MMDLPFGRDELAAIRLFITVFVTGALGAHAYYRARSLADTGSPKRWAFSLYSCAFALTSSLNMLSLLITVASRTYGRIPWVRLGTFTVVLILTYMAVAMMNHRDTQRKPSL